MSSYLEVEANVQLLRGRGLMSSYLEVEGLMSSYLEVEV